MCNHEIRGVGCFDIATARVGAWTFPVKTFLRETACRRGSRREADFATQRSRNPDRPVSAILLHADGPPLQYWRGGYRQIVHN
jgi:hypothetical protein